MRVDQAIMRSETQRLELMNRPVDIGGGEIALLDPESYKYRQAELYAHKEKLESQQRALKFEDPARVVLELVTNSLLYSDPADRKATSYTTDGEQVATALNALVPLILPVDVGATDATQIGFDTAAIAKYGRNDISGLLNELETQLIKVLPRIIREGRFDQTGEAKLDRIARIDDARYRIEAGFQERRNLSATPGLAGHATTMASQAQRRLLGEDYDSLKVGSPNDLLYKAGILWSVLKDTQD